jgi:uncharacterized protein YozE (UPF0346 family)
MLLEINDANYPISLDRFDELWSLTELDPKLVEELEVLADLISAFEDRRYPLMNDPTYRDLLNERINRQVVSK